MPDLQQGSSDKKGDPRERFPKGEVDEKRLERIYDNLLEMVTEKMDVSPTEVHPETDVQFDLGLDSLQIYEIVVDLEELYRVRLSDEDLEKIHTVQDFVDLVYNMTK